MSPHKIKSVRYMNSVKCAMFGGARAHLETKLERDKAKTRNEYTMNKHAKTATRIHFVFSHKAEYMPNKNIHFSTIYFCFHWVKRIHDVLCQRVVCVLVTVTFFWGMLLFTNICIWQLNKVIFRNIYQNKSIVARRFIFFFNWLWFRLSLFSSSLSDVRRTIYISKWKFRDVQIIENA